jgi:glycosyltransferase involved in cell wall biosynthesis
MDLNNKHVLVITSVCPQTPTGNHGAFVREAVLQCQPLGAQFSIFAPAYEASPGEVMEGIRIHRFRYCPKRFENLVRDGAPSKLQRQPLNVIPAAMYILLGTFQLFWVCLQEKPDVLHVNWPFPHALMALPASKLLKIPMVFSFHGAELLLANKFPFVASLLKWLLPMAGSVTANSSFTQGLIRKLYAGPIAIVPYGLTITAKPPKARPTGEPPRLLFVGRLDERKGLRYLIEALPLILKQQPVQLRIVGAGILEQDIRDQCRALGLDSIIHFLGFVSKEELADEYACCDIFVLPAIVDSKGDTEGLGIVLIEALAHEKPVVATQVGGIPDVIKSEVTGLLVPDKNPKALAQAILETLANPASAQERAQRGLQDVQVRFSWDRIRLLWETTFATALSNANNPAATRSVENGPVTQGTVAKGAIRKAI